MADKQTKTILFDLDGTLLPIGQSTFVETYLEELGKKLAAEGFDSARAIKAIWAGTKVMVQNRGEELNHAVFWREFAFAMGMGNEFTAEQLSEIEKTCDKFYLNEFNIVKKAANITPLSKKLVYMLKDKGYDLILATNSLFPPEAIQSRLAWLDLSPEDFLYITDYKNSHYCKPGLGYYREIFEKTGKDPVQCLMVGNNVEEDLRARELGCHIYLVTDYLENEHALDISQFPHGSLADFYAAASAFPAVNTI